MQSPTPVVNCHFVHCPGSCNDRRPYSCAVTATHPGAAGSNAPQMVTPTGRPVRTAAFFDLDKTVIAKSSTLAFSKPFFNQGLLNRRTVLKSSYAQFLFMMSGADRDQMDRMRSYVTSMCTGWDVEQVKSIVAETLHDIVDPLVFAEAADLIADHRLCGRDVVIVSASGEEVVAPIARALGATHAMATRMVVEDGKYTGDIAFYCFGEGKAQAIRELAHARDIRSNTAMRTPIRYRPADAASCRTSGRGQPGPSVAQRSRGTGLAGAGILHRCRSATGSRHRPEPRWRRRPHSVSARSRPAL